MSTNDRIEAISDPQIRWAAWCDKKLVEATKAAKERAGKGWDLLAPELQSAMIAYQVLATVNVNNESPGWEKASDLAARFFQNVDKTGE